MGNKKYVRKLAKFPIVLLLLPISILLMAWGGTGHRMISLNISSSFTNEMEPFQDWVVFLSDHASDADYRKNDDPSEGPRHYIDIDNYPEFVSGARIPQTIDSVTVIHGEGFVEENGSLPWATMDTYKALVLAFEQEDWGKAKILAAAFFPKAGFNP